MPRVATTLLGAYFEGWLRYVDPNALQSTRDCEQEEEATLTSSPTVNHLNILRGSLGQTMQDHGAVELRESSVKIVVGLSFMGLGAPKFFPVLIHTTNLSLDFRVVRSSDTLATA